MTTSVPPPLPAATRPGAPGRAENPGRRSDAEPFASALDGALADRRGPADADGTAAHGPGRASAPERPEDTADDGGGSGTTGAGTATPTGPPPWAVALGQAVGAVTGGSAVPTGAVPVAGAAAGVTGVAGTPDPTTGTAVDEGVPVPGRPVAAGADAVAGSAPGRAVAEARVNGLAVGLLGGTPPGQERAAAEPGAPVGDSGGGPAPGRAGAAGALPAHAAAAAQAQALLRAAGATGLDVVADTGTAAGAPAGSSPTGPVPVSGPAQAPAPTAPGQAGSAVDVTAGPGALLPDGAGPEAGTSDAGTSTGESAVVLGTPATTVPTAVATNDVDGATGAATATPVSAQLARQVAVLRTAADGSHTMTLVLTPETLGPVEISVTVSSGTLDVTLRSANELGRAALQDALPDLRRDLEQAGVTVNRAEVDRDTSSRFSDQARQHAGQQQGFGDRSGQQSPPDGRSRPWLRPADSGETRTVPTTGSTASGVDVRV